MIKFIIGKLSLMVFVSSILSCTTVTKTENTGLQTKKEKILKPDFPVYLEAENQWGVYATVKTPNSLFIRLDRIVENGVSKKINGHYVVKSTIVLSPDLSRTVAEIEKVSYYYNQKFTGEHLFKGKIYDTDGRVGLFGKLKTIKEKLNKYRSKMEEKNTDKNLMDLQLSMIRKELSPTMDIKPRKIFWIVPSKELLNLIKINEAKHKG